jgi:hypothetical protein
VQLTANETEDSVVASSNIIVGDAISGAYVENLYKPHFYKRLPRFEEVAIN